MTQKALAAGVPVVAVPFGRDQFEVARRVEVSGAGVRLPVRKLSTTRLRDAVAAARQKRDAAQSLARSLAAAGGAERAADEIEALVGSRRIPVPKQQSGRSTRTGGRADSAINGSGG